MYNTEKFIQKAIEKHGNFYDYSSVDYKGSREKVEIICPKHGSFWQRADAHLEGKGCPLCGHEKTGLATRKNIENKIKVTFPKVSIIENPKLCTNSTIIGSVYIFINVINNKVYIGKTIDSYTYRWSCHKNSSKLHNYYFYKAINKYGWDNFNKYVIFQTEELENTKENKEYLDKIILEKEKYYINFYKSNNSEYGYNLTNGGEGVVGYKPSEDYLEKRKLIGKIVEQYDLNGNLLKEWPTMKMIKEKLNIGVDGIRECCNNKRESFKGFIWKFKSKSKIENDISNSYNPNCKSILQYSLNGKFIKEWNSASEIQEKLGLDNHTIRACCRGNYNTCGNYIWLYKESNNIIQNLDKQILINRKLYTPYIAQYDLNNNLIALWYNTSQLEKEGFNRNSIRACIRGKNKTSRGHIWKEIDRDLINNEDKNKIKAFRDDIEQ